MNDTYLCYLILVLNIFYQPGKDTLIMSEYKTWNLVYASQYLHETRESML